MKSTKNLEADGIREYERAGQTKELEMNRYRHGIVGNVGNQ